MSIHEKLNTTVTRVQLYAVVGIAILLVLGWRGVVLLQDMNDSGVALTPTVTAAHGIETTWRSEQGGHRLWSLTAGRSDYRPWVEEHIAAFKTAEELLPPIEGRK